MKRCLILVTSFMLLLGVSAFGQTGDVSVQIDGGANQVYIGESAIVEYLFTNSDPIAGLSVGFEFTWTAGGTFSWDNTYGDAGGTGGVYILKHGPAIGAFDLGGTLSDGSAMPNAINWGGAALSTPFPANAVPTLAYSMKLDAANDNSETPGGFCIDAAAVLVADWSMTFVAPPGGTIPPDFNGNPTGDVLNPQAPSACFDVVERVCTAPAFTATPAASENKNHCMSFSFDFDADPNPAPGNTPPATITGFSASVGNINASTGEFSIDGPADCAGPQDVTVTVTNSCGGSTDYNFAISWTNNDPSITNCPAGVGKVGKGNDFNLNLDATDPDPCDALTWSVSTADSPVGPYSIDGTGQFLFETDDADGGNTYTFVAEAVDPCGGVGSCTFEVEVLETEPFLIQIEKTHQTIQGQYEYVSITKVAGSEQIGGYDFLIGYDASALSFISAELGAAVGPAPGLGWEYFTYRYGAFGNCEGPCPSGKLRVVAIADANNGPNHPAGFNVPSGGELASLKFFVTNDRTYECQYVPIRFCWIDCGDNGLSSVTGDTLFISDRVFEFEWDGTFTDPDIDLWEITDLSCYFAMSFGGACADCDVSDKYEPVRFINFWNGGIDIACADSIDDRGDINLNKIPNEIADAVLYTNFFLYGYGALDPNPQYREAQIAASDVNNDGTPLSVGDLVYLLRIIVGDELAFPKLAPFANTANVSLAHGTLSTNASVELGAVYATFEVNGAYDVVSHTDMEVLSAENDGQLKVLVYAGTSNMSNAIDAGAADLFTVNGNVELVDVQVSDYNGNMLNTQISKSVLPTSFALHQNVPNPFNPTTKIGLDLPTASDWSISIYNVAGQLVESFSGNGVGTVTVEWDANNVASGIYFYKATVADWTQTKKMVLMK